MKAAAEDLLVLEESKGHQFVWYCAPQTGGDEPILREVFSSGKGSPSLAPVSWGAEEDGGIRKRLQLKFQRVRESVAMQRRVA